MSQPAMILGSCKFAAVEAADGRVAEMAGPPQNVGLSVLLEDVGGMMRQRIPVALAIAAGEIDPDLRSEMANRISRCAVHVSYAAWAKWGPLTVAAFSKEIAKEFLPAVRRLLGATANTVHAGVAFSDDAQDQQQLFMLARAAFQTAVSARQKVFVLDGAEARHALPEFLRQPQTTGGTSP